VSKPAFARIVQRRPGLIEDLSRVIARRRAALEAAGNAAGLRFTVRV